MLFLHGERGDQHGVGPLLHDGAHARELAGAEGPRRVGELRADAHGAALGIERAVHEDDAALVGEEAVIGQVQLELRPRALSPAPVVEADARGEPEIVGFGDADVGVDGVHRGDRHEQRGLALAHQVPAVHLDFADDPGDGGLDGRVAEIQLRLGDGGLGRLDRGIGELDLGALGELGILEGSLGPFHAGRGHFLRGLGGVQILLRDRPRLGQRPVPGDVTAGLLEIGLALVELGLGTRDDRGVPCPRGVGLGLGELSARGLERRRVFLGLDDEERLPRRDLRAFLERHPLDHTGDAGSHFHGGHRFRAGREVTHDGHRVLHHLGHHDRGRGRGSLLGALGAVAGGSGGDKQADRHQAFRQSIAKHFHDPSP